MSKSRLTSATIATAAACLAGTVVVAPQSAQATTLGYQRVEPTKRECTDSLSAAIRVKKSMGYRITIIYPCKDLGGKWGYYFHYSD